MSAYRSLTIDVPLVNLKYCGVPLQRSGTLESFGNAVPIDVHEEWVSKRMEQLCAEPLIHHLVMVLILSGYIVETILVYQDISSQSSTDVYAFSLNPASMHYSAERIQSATDIPTRWWELTETDLTSLPGAKSVIGFNLTNRYCALPGQQYSYGVALPQFNQPGISVVDSWLFCWSTASSFEFDQLFQATKTAATEAEIALRLQLQTQFDANRPDNSGRTKTRVGLLHNVTPYDCWKLTPPADLKVPVTWGHALYSREGSHLGEEAVWNYVYRIWMGLLQNPLVQPVEKLYQSNLDFIVSTLIAADPKNKELAAANLGRYVSFLSDMMDDQVSAPGAIDAQFEAVKGSLGKLSWAELLFTLHNLRLIDMLSGVDVRPIPPATAAITPMVPYDATGFYELTEGEFTLQINQAGNYWRGHYQMRLNQVLRRIVHYSFEVDNVVLHTSGGVTSATAGITLTREDNGPLGIPYDGDDPDLPVPAQRTADLTVALVPDPDHIGRLIPQNVALTFSEDEYGYFIRTDAAPFLADDVLLNLEPDIRDLYVANQRSPLHSSERQTLDTLTAGLIGFAYSSVAIAQDEEFMFEFLDVMQVYGQYGGFGTLNEGQAQLPAVRHYIVDKLQTAPPPGNATTVPWVALLNALYQRRNQVPSDPHVGMTVYQVIMTYLDIDENELNALIEETSEGDFVYEWTMGGIQIGTPTMNPWIGGASTGFDFHVKQIKPVPEANDARWPTILGGNMAGGGFGASPTKISGSGVVFQTSPAQLNAQIAWEPKDFEGKVWLYGMDFTITVVLGGSMGPGQIVVYGNRANAAPLVGGTGDFTLMAGLSVSVGVSSSIGMMFLKSDEADAPIPIARYVEVTKWQQGEDQHFEVGLSTLTPQGWLRLKGLVAESRAGLEGAYSFMEISGFASPTGGSEFNQTLSQNRAQAVFNGIYQLLGPAMHTPTHQTIVRGYGMEPSILIGNVQEGQENAAWRRVDIRLNGVLLAQLQGS